MNGDHVRSAVVQRPAVWAAQDSICGGVPVWGVGDSPAPPPVVVHDCFHWSLYSGSVGRIFAVRTALVAGADASDGEDPGCFPPGTGSVDLVGPARPSIFNEGLEFRSYRGGVIDREYLRQPARGAYAGPGRCRCAGRRPRPRPGRCPGPPSLSPDSFMVRGTGYSRGPATGMSRILERGDPSPSNPRHAAAAPR